MAYSSSERARSLRLRVAGRLPTWLKSISMGRLLSTWGGRLDGDALFTPPCRSWLGRSGGLDAPRIVVPGISGPIGAVACLR